MSMARLFTRKTANPLPPATGLMVFARREGLISTLLSGLSNQDEGIQVEATKQILLTYYQSKGKRLEEAHEDVQNVPENDLRRLVTSLVKLANTYNWE